ncbi:Carbohydrate-binding CenC domain protein [Pseudopedobacter saltans DSM 12145]|uniref:endo-1,4-beta-xylanase n=1 Tax=Pseudopedobacter saltans (strain ATCC 51119 / DSM 12145 / JCM 21818 / CCUG 39354 / LMG 10337 / NBRC 100064 / NCIMB 13643) TaxID=762903 RepID=F0S4T7_PSESL|nr:endo-1,4-beta-xylanase [Pseudopedobacter saltans]ADY53105.1 Carbohydrate-binding CenC domain protein [Pseudopedobacter saltans DSM 12145]
MNQIYRIIIGLTVSAVAASCTKHELLDYHVDKPLSFANQEQIDAYKTLKSYINKESNPNFKLGVAMSISEYVDKGVMYRLANTNFDELVMGYEMKHGAVVKSDGKLDLENVKKLLKTASAAGIGIYGHTLCWHANQNAAYLNGLIAPMIIPATGGPSWDIVTAADFETDNNANYEANTNARLSFTAVGEGAGGKGRALKITNDVVRTNDWDVQFFIKVSPAVKKGEQYEFSMDVRSDINASFSTQAHTVPYSYKHWDFFGTISSTPTWTKYTKVITISDNEDNCGAIAFNLGKAATNYYFDNVTLKKFNPKGGGSSGTEIIANFDSDALGKTYTMTNGGSATVVNGPDNAGKVLNVKSNQSHPKFNVTLPVGVNLGHCESVTLDFYGTGSTGLYGQGMKMSINGGTLASFNSPSVFGCPDGGWGRGKIVLPFSSLSLTAEQKKLNSFTLEVGSGTGSGDYYIDNIVLNWKSTGDLVVEKTPEEKKIIIRNALTTFISGMVDTCKWYVKAWDVVNEPMDDGKPYELKTGIGKANMTSDEFYWQDYLGKDYAVEAFKLAMQHGNPNDKLFINDYNLEYSIDKCKGLIEYAKYIESKGARVDGIGTQMHISTTADKQKIAEMFTLLAATGKLIKVSELDIGIAGKKTADATEGDYKAQAEMYKYVIDKYFELIPASQRYGITIWSPKDSPANSSWRAGEPIGLWTEGYTRKPSYVGVAEGLNGK